MKNIQKKAYRMSFILLPLLTLSFGIVSCGSGNNNDGRRGFGNTVSSQPRLLTDGNKGCYDIDIDNGRDLQFSFAAIQHDYSYYLETYVSEGHNPDGSERIETNSYDTEIVYYDDYDDGIFSGYIDVTERDMAVILADLGYPGNEDELCVDGLDFDFRGNGLNQIYLVVKGRRTPLLDWY